MKTTFADTANDEAALLKVNNNTKVFLTIFETLPQSSPWSAFTFALFSAVFFNYFFEWL
jgi:hypothetical protein